MPDHIDRQNFITSQWRKWRLRLELLGEPLPSFDEQRQYCRWIGGRYDLGERA